MISGTRLLRRGGFLASVVFAAVSPLLSGSTPAHADAVAAVATTPADGSSVVTSPPQITITFNQQIGSTASALIVCNGQPAPQPLARVSADGLGLVVDITATPLPKGSCAVRWQVQGLAEPGVQKGTFSFTVQQDTVPVVAVADATGTTAAATAAVPAATDTTDTADTGTKLGGPLGLTRLLSTLAIATLFGSFVLITVAWPEGVEYILTIRFLRYTWAIALVSTVAVVAILTAQATGKAFTASLVPTTWSDLTDTTPGLAALARVALVAAVGWVAIRPERCIDPTTQLIAIALPGLAVATLGFTRTGGDLEIIGYSAGVAHALAMAVWLGGLVLLGRVVLAGPGEDDLVHAVRGFGRLATPAMLITVVTGGVQLYRLDSGHILDTRHGQLMLLKVVPVVAMVFVGVATRQFVHARLARADAMAAPIAARLRRAVGMEAVIGVIVLGITSAMLAAHPANLIAEARTSDSFLYQQQFVDPAATFDVKLSIDPAKVGRNELFFEVTTPLTGITQIQIQFTPPLGSAANPVLMTIDQLHGVGAAHLDRAIGIPLGAPGAWNVTVQIVTAAGPFTQTNVLNVRSSGGQTVDAPITPVTQPPVTSPPVETTTTTTVG